jgi:hypothetical protein
MISASAVDPNAPPPLSAGQRLSRALSSVIPGHHAEDSTKPKPSQ